MLCGHPSVSLAGRRGSPCPTLRLRAAGAPFQRLGFFPKCFQGCPLESLPHAAAGLSVADRGPVTALCKTSRWRTRGGRVCAPSSVMFHHALPWNSCRWNAEREPPSCVCLWLCTCPTQGNAPPTLPCRPGTQPGEPPQRNGPGLTGWAWPGLLQHLPLRIGGPGNPQISVSMAPLHPRSVLQGLA